MKATYRADVERSIKPYEPGDRDALREFQREYFGANSRQANDGFFHWAFERNPHKPPERPSLWICKRDGKVVGQFGSLPVRLKVRNEEARAAWVIDWMVHRGWRLKGVGPALLDAYMRSTDVMLGLVFEKAAYQSMVKTGWKDGRNLSLFVRPLIPDACAKGLGAPAFAAKLTPRAPVSASAHMAARAVRTFWRTSLEPISAFDERVNAVWAEAKDDYPILVRRDFEFLRWRFDEIPYRGIYRRYYLKRAGKVIGYAVTKVDVWQREHLAGRVVDYLVPRRYLRPLLALVTEELRMQNAVAMFLDRMDRESEKSLWPIGCIRVRDADQFMFNTRDPASPLLTDLANAGNWFITLLDSDADHIAIEGQLKNGYIQEAVLQPAPAV